MKDALKIVHIITSRLLLPDYNNVYYLLDKIDFVSNIVHKLFLSSCTLLSRTRFAFLLAVDNSIHDSVYSPLFNFPGTVVVS